MNKINTFTKSDFKSFHVLEGKNKLAIKETELTISSPATKAFLDNLAISYGAEPIFYRENDECLFAPDNRDLFAYHQSKLKGLSSEQFFDSADIMMESFINSEQTHVLFQPFICCAIFSEYFHEDALNDFKITTLFEHLIKCCHSLLQNKKIKEPRFIRICQKLFDTICMHAHNEAVPHAILDKLLSQLLMYTGAKFLNKGNTTALTNLPLNKQFTFHISLLRFQGESFSLLFAQHMMEWNKTLTQQQGRNFWITPFYITEPIRYDTNNNASVKHGCTLYVLMSHLSRKNHFPVISLLQQTEQLFDSVFLEDIADYINDRTIKTVNHTMHGIASLSVLNFTSLERTPQWALWFDELLELLDVGNINQIENWVFGNNSSMALFLHIAEKKKHLLKITDYEILIEKSIYMESYELATQIFNLTQATPRTGDYVGHYYRMAACPKHSKSLLPIFTPYYDKFPQDKRISILEGMNKNEIKLIKNLSPELSFIANPLLLNDIKNSDFLSIALELLNLTPYKAMPYITNNVVKLMCLELL